MIVLKKGEIEKNVYSFVTMQVKHISLINIVNKSYKFYIVLNTFFIVGYSLFY